jgi:hypothetical protein
MKVSSESRSCGKICSVAAIVMEETDIAAGQVLPLGGLDPTHDSTAQVQLVGSSHRRVYTSAPPPPMPSAQTTRLSGSRAPAAEVELRCAHAGGKVY